MMDYRRERGENLRYESSSQGRKRPREEDIARSENTSIKRSTMLNLKEGPEISAEEREQILKMVAESEPEVEALDSSMLRKLLVSFEKKVKKNTEMRIKYVDNPEKFLESELDLHDEVQKLHVIATAPELYNILIQQNSMQTILGLLSHENSDIGIAVADLLLELTDVDTLNESEESSEVLLDALLEGQIVALLVQNMERLDENIKEEADGIHNTLGIIENLTDLKPEICATAGEQGLVAWLMKRLRKAPVYDANKLYSSEILSILLQNNQENRQLLGAVNGIDVLLQCLSAYKPRDPSTANEIEYMENLFNCLCSSLMAVANRERFLKGQGLQLMILMLREKKLSRRSALKVLDYAMQGVEGADNCTKFIDVLGLRSLFALFMKPPKSNKKVGSKEGEYEEHVMSILASLFRNLSGSQRSRLVQKFVEEDHIKVDRLIELHFKYFELVQDCDNKIERQKNTILSQGDEIDETTEEDFYLQRLDAGLFILQLIDTVVVECCSSGNAAIKTRVQTLLNQQGGNMKDIRSILREYAASFGDEKGKDREELEKRRILSLVDRF
ncbi:beta-catenin-like protein 1 [Xenia sp. Carnegie-2017]|uniref:beta-catenin-like protein 1 n=1 Tax=Xenia sp. Carnegie-2017 TaxID=2897299 RepID=UPI001F048127|nr:beta-catenin-like protein 1 [Xenia sp. Carnegie-2017]